MLITRIELENIKSYRQVSIDFQRGTTAISGANGAGKTTIVEAIGFALFGYLSYRNEQFVREGEKTGKVLVKLIGNDDRPYVVERRVGTGARWSIYDEEANIRLEQRADVTDKLHDLLGIDRERPLDSLFRDALGVPQGTFTAIFLDTASKRKQTFDALLQIEDYKTASDRLLDTQRLYKDQLSIQQGEIKLLEQKTQDLPEWRTRHKEARLIAQRQKERLAQQSQLLGQYKAHADILEIQQKTLQQLQHAHDQEQKNYIHASQTLEERQNQLTQAQNARQIILQTREDYQQHRQAQQDLQELRQQANKRDRLRQNLADLRNQDTEIRERIRNLHERLTEIKNASQKIIELAPLVEQQAQLEQAHDEAKKQYSTYLHLVDEGKRVRLRYDQFQRDLHDQENKLIEIEPFIPLARLLDERRDILEQLRIQVNERNSKQKLLQDKYNQLQEKLKRNESNAAKLKEYETRINAIEEHRQEAEQCAGLQEQHDQLSMQGLRLEGNIEGYTRSRAQSASGQCPLLNESCLNIRQKGIASLETYFDTLLTTEHEQLQHIHIQQDSLLVSIEKIKPYAQALQKEEQYREQQAEYIKIQHDLSQEIDLLKQECSTLKQELSELNSIDQRTRRATLDMKESLDADTKVRDLAGTNQQIIYLREKITQLDTELQERRQEASRYKQSEAQAKQLFDQIQELNDPRGESKEHQKTVTRADYYNQSLIEAEDKRKSIQAHIAQQEQDMLPYQALDHEIEQQEIKLRQSEENYQAYLSHSNEANQLPAREQAYQEQSQKADDIARHLQTLKQELHTASTAFDQEELTILKGNIEQLNADHIQLTNDILHHEKSINDLERQIETAEEQCKELDVARVEGKALEDLQTMTEQFRKLIKDAAPFVLKEMLKDISAEANRIFGEIIGDRSGQLSWQKDYEIVLRRQGVERSFAQLSGGEQMSAALAIRLALLKKLSSLNIAFFDEPTQNMDEMRRTNLAKQIRRVRGFDQLIVISHDDTFEQSLDSLIRLHKEQAETRVLTDEEAPDTNEIMLTRDDLGSSMIVVSNR